MPQGNAFWLSRFVLPAPEGGCAMKVGFEGVGEAGGVVVAGAAGDLFDGEVGVGQEGSGKLHTLSYEPVVKAGAGVFFKQGFEFCVTHENFRGQRSDGIGQAGLLPDFMQEGFHICFLETAHGACFKA